MPARGRRSAEPFEVLLTADAVRDLEEIAGWIAASTRVYVYLRADGRRDMQTLLARRLLAAR